LLRSWLGFTRSSGSCDLPHNSGREARTLTPQTSLGAPSSVLERGVFDSAFSCASRIHRNHLPALITVQPSISTVRCKTLNNFSKVCYSLPCLPPRILADLLILSLV